MVERFDRRHYRSLLYVPATDDLYVIGWRRATALCHGELAMPNLAGQRIFIGHIAYSIVDAEMVDILPITGSRYLIGPDGCVDEAEKTADWNAVFLTIIPSHSAPRRSRRHSECSAGVSKSRAGCLAPRPRQSSLPALRSTSSLVSGARSSIRRHGHCGS